jgi:two-component system, cell cycle sensor histidine kinase and response regulator CckA
MTRVLIVDDKPESLYLLRVLLAGNGYAVDEARHGAEALVKAHQEPPQVIVSDLLMPVMDGYTLLRQWKSDERLRTVPFVVYTATYTDPQDERLALDLGADAFVLKPAEPEAFMIQLRDVLAKTSRGELPRSNVPDAPTPSLLTQYSKVLVRKLEEKALQLQEANRTLQEDLQRRTRAEAKAERAHAALLRMMEEQRQANERIREQAMLLDIATDGIMVRDMQHQILFWNQGCERLYGWTAAEAVGQSSSALLTTDPAMFDGACAAVLRENNWTGEMCQHTKSRQEIVVLSRWSLVRDAQGEPKSVLIINTDITERKRLQAQLFRAQRLESIGQLASGIAHDLNNILAPLIMVSPLLRAEIRDPATLRLVDLMEANTKRGAEIVKQVLMFSRGLKTGKGPVPLRPLLQEIGAMVQETFPKSIKAVVTAPENIWIVECDATQIHQILMNLCVNARDAMLDGGFLNLEVENVVVDDAFARLVPGAKPGSYVALLVADTGTGIPAELMDRIFDPFFTTKEPGKGTGLGLSTVLGIVQEHGGFLRVESQPGKGTQFRVYLPAKAESPGSDLARPGAAPRGQGETILVVDDEESVRMTTRKILERFGYRVLVASEGSEAVVVYSQHANQINLVLTDLVMPLMDGTALIRALLKSAPQLKIIGMTGATDAAQASVVRRLQICGVLQKPYTASLLLQSLRTVLDGGTLSCTTDFGLPTLAADPRMP